MMSKFRTSILSVAFRRDRSGRRRKGGDGRRPEPGIRQRFATTLQG